MVRRVHERPRVCTSGLTVSAAMGRLVVIEGLDGAGKNTLTFAASTKAVTVNMVFDPPWDQSRMSDEARVALDMW